MRFEGFPAMKATVVVALALTAVLAAQLPPEIQLDRYMRQADTAIALEDYQAASAALDKAGEVGLGHGLELPALYYFRTAQVAVRTGYPDRARQYAERYLALSGRDGEFNAQALDLLDVAKTHASIAELACTGEEHGQPCWLEVANRSGCYIWNTGRLDDPFVRLIREATWSGECAGGLAQGNGTVGWESFRDTRREATGWMRGGKLHGKVTKVERYKDSGDETSRVPYVNGEPHGVEESYHEDGSLSFRKHWANGKPHGVEESYRSDGSLSFRTHWANGKPHGVEEWCNPSGTLAEKTDYVNGERHGVRESYDVNGTLFQRTPYVNDKRHGVVERFREDGSLEGRWVWVNDEKHE